jgi:hypothetical protein
MQAIVDRSPNFGFWVLSLLVGMPTALQLAQAYSLASWLPFPFILLFSLIAAIPLGALWLCIMGGILYLTGKWLGGKACFAEVRLALAWSSALMWFFFNISCAALLVYYGAQWFCPTWINLQVSQSMMYVALILWVTHVVVVLWSLYVLVHALAQVQGFSVWKSLGNIVLSGVVLWGIVRALS